MNPRNVRLYAWERPAHFFADDKRWELVPGEMSEDAVWVFTRGQCHSLALALHEATGWPIVGANDPWEGLPGHVAVETPDGGILDIRGYWDDAEGWVREYGGRELTYHDPGELRDAFNGNYRKPRVDAARHWVEPVLEEYRYADIASAA